MILKKFFLFTLALLLVGTRPAIAEVESVPDPIQLITKLQPTGGARGIVFQENIDAAVSIGWIRYSRIPTFDSNGAIIANDWDSIACRTWLDSNCKAESGFYTEGKVVLGKCLDNVEIGCLENLVIQDASGQDLTLRYVGPSFAKVIDSPEIPELGIPRSSSPPIFIDKTGRNYVVRAGLWVDRLGNELPNFRLDVDVTPVVAIQDQSISAPIVVRSIEPRTGRGNVMVIPSPSSCISIDAGICYKAIKLDKDVKIHVDVRIPSNIKGWFKGRMSDADFKVKKINQKSQLVSVTAKPANVAIAGGWAKYSDLPTDFIDKLWPSGGYARSPTASYFLISDPSHGDGGVKNYLAWAPYIGDKALTTVTTWSFGTNMPNSKVECLNAPGEVAGFVGSNATVYSSNPPEWNSQDSALTYKVAAPHFDEIGNQNIGSYTLAIPIKSIECLYGQTKVPTAAQVSLVYENEVVSVSTITLKSESGWVYFKADGFHFSSPTIQVKFAQPTLVSPTSAPKIQIAIQCRKNKSTKKVTGLNPKCPTGYKKVA